MKGWYIPARQDHGNDEGTAWYASFWGFCAAYLRARFGACSQGRKQGHGSARQDVPVRHSRRMARFLMNAMLAAGGYPWTIVPVERRETYMAALEEASVRQNILPFTGFLARLVKGGLRGRVAAKLPEE